MDFIKANDLDRQNLIVINSPGGNVSTALDLGRLIRKRGMNIIVGRTSTSEPPGAGRSFQSYEAGICASACVFVLMAGVTRDIADEDSQVGVHQFAPMSDEVGSIKSATSSTQSVVAMLQTYAASMGVNPTILVLASTTRPEDMIWLTLKQMESLNLLTTRSFRTWADWALKPSRGVLMAVAVQEQSDGRTTSLLVDCRSLNVGFELPTSERVADIAASIRGARLTLDGMQASLPLTVANVSSDGRMIVVTFQGGPNILGAIVRSDNRLNIDVDLPRLYWEEFGGPTFDIPTSNIAEVAPHVLNTCK